MRLHINGVQTKQHVYYAARYHVMWVSFILDQANAMDHRSMLPPGLLTFTNTLWIINNFCSVVRSNALERTGESVHLDVHLNAGRTNKDTPEHTRAHTHTRNASRKPHRWSRWRSVRLRVYKYPECGHAVSNRVKWEWETIFYMLMHIWPLLKCACHALLTWRLLQTYRIARSNSGSTVVESGKYI